MKSIHICDLVPFPAICITFNSGIFGVGSSRPRLYFFFCDNVDIIFHAIVGKLNDLARESPFYYCIVRLTFGGGT